MAQNRDNSELYKLLFYAALIGGGYYVIRKTLVKLNIVNPDAERIEQKTKADLEKYQKEILAKQKSTKTDGEWAMIADTLYNDLNQFWWDKTGDALYQANRVQNDADVVKLFQAFGYRVPHYFGIPMNPAPLNVYLKDRMSSAYMTELNNAYRRKGIKYQY